jgi:hypothetical protein
MSQIISRHRVCHAYAFVLTLGATALEAADIVAQLFLITPGCVHAAVLPDEVTP